MSQNRLDEFELSRELGRGGSGIVYEASREGAHVALKVQRELDQREKERFLREAELMKRVSHPALVKLVGSGVFSDGRAYLVMDLLHGETLSERLRRGALPVAEAVRAFAPLASAVQTLHEANLVHRDIKPENIMLAREPSGAVHPVLLDFGIVREVNGLSSTTTQAGFVRGSRAYMAPERFFGQGASVASDVYELGVTLYMMLAGRLPWGEEDAAGSRLDPEALPRPSGRALSRVVMRAISTRPEQRFASAGEFRDAVIAAADAESVPELSRTTDAEPALVPKATPSDTDNAASVTVEAPLMPASVVPPSQVTTKPMSVRGRSRVAWVIAATALALGAGGAIAWSRFAPHRASDSSAPPEPTASSVAPALTAAASAAPSRGAPNETSAASAIGLAPPTPSAATTPATEVTRANSRGSTTGAKTRPADGARAAASATSKPGASGGTRPAPSSAPSAPVDVYYIDRR